MENWLNLELQNCVWLNLQHWKIITCIKFSSLFLDPEKETFTCTTDSADIESEENDIVFGDSVPEQEIDDTIAICSDLFQQFIEANFPEGRTNGIHNFTDIEIAPVDNESLDDIFIHPIGKWIMQ